MWKWKQILSGGVATFWVVARVIGLAGLPDDFQTLMDVIFMIPDWIGASALTAFCIFSWQSESGQRWRFQLIQWASLRFRSIFTIIVRHKSAGDEWNTIKVSTAAGLVHRIPLKDDGKVKIIEIVNQWTMKFIDMPSSEHFWRAEIDNGTRRYVCRHIPAGHGYREAKFTLAPVEICERSS